MYCSEACSLKTHNVNPDAPRFTPAEILALEEASDRNLRAFYEGVPPGELPAGARRRLGEISEKVKQR